MSGAGTALLRLGTAALRRATAAGGPPQASASAAGARRAFGAGTKGSTYEGVTIHEPEAWQTNLANGVTALMWYGLPSASRVPSRTGTLDPSPRGVLQIRRALRVSHCVVPASDAARARAASSRAQVLDPPPRQE